MAVYRIEFAEMGEFSLQIFAKYSLLYQKVAFWIKIAKLLINCVQTRSFPSATEKLAGG
ncbi:hypothetical protein [Roseovarius marisflavi]|uniref:hypothetical protein n=1 Tax=Roseovarius marisflavi TaxID=1054996 RepID=UPI001C65A3E2|nr:hypothetical protein [Roseovarius marisflavi]